MTRTSIIRFLNSLNKYTRYIKEYRSKTVLPSYLHETIIGLLLSDGALEKSSLTSAARLNVVFGIKHGAYLLHLYNLFEPYVNNLPDIKEVYNKKTDSFNTNSFIQTDVQLLAQAITNKLNIKTKVVHDRNDQYIIMISKDQLSLVRSLILPYMHPSMLYKLGLEYNKDGFDYHSVLKAI